MAKPNRLCANCGHREHDHMDMPYLDALGFGGAERNPHNDPDQAKLLQKIVDSGLRLRCSANIDDLDPAARNPATRPPTPPIIRLLSLFRTHGILPASATDDDLHVLRDQLQAALLEEATDHVERWWKARNAGKFGDMSIYSELPNDPESIAYREAEMLDDADGDQRQMYKNMAMSAAHGVYYTCGCPGFKAKKGAR